jgi:hypothetical protein
VTVTSYERNASVRTPSMDLRASLTLVTWVANTTVFATTGSASALRLGPVKIVVCQSAPSTAMVKEFAWFGTLTFVAASVPTLLGKMRVSASLEEGGSFVN